MSLYQGADKLAFLVGIVELVCCSEASGFILDNSAVISFIGNHGQNEHSLSSTSFHDPLLSGPTDGSTEIENTSALKACEKSQHKACDNSDSTESVTPRHLYTATQ